MGGSSVGSGDGLGRQREELGTWMKGDSEMGNTGGSRSEGEDDEATSTS